MTENTKVAAIPSGAIRLQALRLAWRPILAGLLIALLYFHVFAKLILDWTQIQDYSHGFIVPPFAGYLLWKKRGSIAAAVSAPTWTGVLVVGLGLATLLAGVYGAELFLSRLSFVILLIGLALAFGGWRILRETIAPILALLLCIPLPAILFVRITFPLQLFASELASFLLPLAGVPVLREGNVLVLPSMSLEVAEACSGIRSLISLLTLAILYAYFRKRSIPQGFLLAVASVPIAIAANALRLLGTGLCVQYWDPDKALGFFHEFSGWVMFLFSLVFLVTVDKLIARLPIWRRPA